MYDKYYSNTVGWHQLTALHINILNNVNFDNQHSEVVYTIIK